MVETRIIEPGKRKWWIQPALAAPLLTDGWPPDRPDRLQAVKIGRARTVSRFESGGKGFFVKAYAAAGFLGRLRSLLGLGPGRREWDALLAARQAGLDVPEPIALSRGGEEVLVTAEIAGGQPLDQYLFERYFEALPGDPPYPGARPPELVSIFRRRRPTPGEDTIDPKTLAYRLADLLAHLADADLYLPDLHPGNILISGGPGQWRLGLVDLVDAVRPASDEAVFRHLVELEHFFEPIAPVAARMQCLRRLCELLGRPIGPRMVTRATAAYRRSFYRHRDHRMRRESKYFSRICVGGWRGWAAADWDDTLARLLAGSENGGRGPLGAAQLPGARALKEGRTSSVWRIPAGDGRPLILKQHNKAGLHGGLGSLGRGSRSLAAFRKGHALLARGIATARPAGAADLREGGLLSQTVLFTEPVEGDPLPQWLRQTPPPAERRRVTRLLARMIRRLHDCGFSHRDLKAPNVLISPARDGRPVLVDLDGLKALWHVSDGRRAQNLMRLSVSLDEWGVARRTDRLRFLRAYLGQRGCPAPMTVRGRRSRKPPPQAHKTAAARRALTPRNLRRWWRKIEQLSGQKLEALERKAPSSRAR